MEKMFRLMRRCQKNVHLRKIWMTMKLTILLIFLAISQIMAVETYSQSTRLSLNLKSVAVKDVLDQIEQKSEFFFLYNSKLINVERTVSVSVKDQKISDLLDKLFQETDVVYTVVDRQIVLTNKADQASFLELKTSEQQKSISGKVTDSSGGSLPGVSVVIKGTTTGTITDANGNYFLATIPKNATLQFSFVGMKAKEIPVDSKTTINVTLELETMDIEEVVALGYTTQKKRDMIGSVAKVTDTQLATPAYSNFTSALQGKASGVFVSGGQVRIRGMNSISLSTDPIWIIDGVPGNASNLNPNDIESVSVLKDASATALYGSSGANGVIAVTTKSMKGKASEIAVEINSGFSELLGTDWDLMNTTDFLAAHDIAKQNAAKYDGKPYVPYDPNKAFDFNVKIKNRMTREEAEKYSHNGLDEALQNGLFYQAYLRASKGFDKGSALFTATYRNEDGNFKGSASQKLVTRIALNYSPKKNVDFSVNSINRYNQADVNQAGNTLRRPPHMPLYDANDPTGYWAPGDNPIINSDKKYRDQNNESFSSLNYLKVNIDLPFIKGLSIAGTTSANIGFSRNVDWYAKELLSYGNAQAISNASEGSSLSKSFLLRAEANYNRVFKENHAFTALAIAEYRKDYQNGLNANGYNLNGTYHILGTPANFTSMSSTIAEGGSIAYIGRLTYKFKERYLLEANIRRDGLSDLDEDNRWATFPSLGAGWILTEESFLKNSFVSLLKIRGSIGKTGNSLVPAFTYLPKFQLRGPSAKAAYDVYMSSMINSIPAKTQWETSDNLDFGFDFGFLNNRINGSLAYYFKKTSGLLLQVPTPPSTGIGFGPNVFWSNVGNMKNDGIEFNVNFSAIRNSDFTWDISFNNTLARNKVLALHPQTDLTGSGIFGGSNTYTMTKKGEELATYYMPDFAGIDPDKGIPLIWERDAEVFKATGNTVRTGNKIPASLANAGANQFLLQGKSYIPSYYGGLSNTFRYNNFDLNIHLTYSGGNYFIDQFEYWTKWMRLGEYNLSSTLLADSWKKPGDIAKEPELIYNGGFYYDNAGNPTTTRNEPFQISTKYLKPADNIQLKEITLGYTLPKTIASKISLAEVRAYANINNVFYWGKAGDRSNPEIGASSNNINGAVRIDSFLPRTYSFGLSVKF